MENSISCISSMKQALEALTDLFVFMEPGAVHHLGREEQYVKAIDDLRQAIKQAEQEKPVAEVWWGDSTDFEYKFKMLVELNCVENVPVKLYAGSFSSPPLYWHDTKSD